VPQENSRQAAFIDVPVGGRNDTKDISERGCKVGSRNWRSTPSNRSVGSRTGGIPTVQP